MHQNHFSLSFTYIPFLNMRKMKKKSQLFWDGMTIINKGYHWKKE